MIRVVDTETTGIEATDKLVEVALVDIENGQIVRHDSTLVDPGLPIPPEASAVHHITDEMVQGFVTPDDAVRSMSGAPVYCAHNAKFDRQFLPYEADWICTYRCGLHLWPDAPRHSNQVLRYWLGIEVPDFAKDLLPHRALFDTAITAQILLLMLREWNVEELVDLTTKPALLGTCTFGKHAGTKWSDVPKDYLRWMLGQDFGEDEAHTARYWLNQ